jgi:hypothetical protein
VFLYVLPDTPTGRRIASGLELACGEVDAAGGLEFHEVLQLDRDSEPFFDLLVPRDLVASQDPHFALVVDPEDSSAFAALASKIGRGSGAQRLVRFTSLRYTELSLTDIRDEVPRRYRQYFPPDLEEGQPLGEATALVVYEHLSPISEGLAEVERLWRDAHQRGRVRFASSGIRSLYAHERDATALALQLGGFPPSEHLPDAEPESGGQTFSAQFATRLRLREDDVLDVDFHFFEGLRGTYQAPRRMSFEADGLQLDVIYANRRVLEEFSGADLIYFNRVFGAWLFIQYKAMEDEPTGAVFRLPSADLEGAIDRMRVLRAQLANTPPPSTPEEYRLNADPFYLKFCPRLHRSTEARGVTSGIYMPIDRYSLLEVSGQVVGPNGGRRITHETAHPYLTSSDFCRLASIGWIGSYRDGSEFLEQLVDLCNQGRRSVVAAFLSSLEETED